LPHRELLTALAELDALLHPSLEESFGVVLAEAMALGLPVVAGRDSGAVPWVLGANPEGKCATGVLTDVRSATGMTNALHTLFDMEYAARSAAGLSRARCYFSPVAVALAYEARYMRTLPCESARCSRLKQGRAQEALP
jgi:glycosyltransferase involved in cell wall biosynthesis